MDVRTGFEGVVARDREDPGRGGRLHDSDDSDAAVPRATPRTQRGRALSPAPPRGYGRTIGGDGEARCARRP
jgi:hypothetical protein